MRANVVDGRIDGKGWLPPNSYYRDGRLSPPRAQVKYAHNGEPVNEMVEIVGVPAYPLKSLTHLPRTFASTRGDTVRTQEQIFLDRSRSLDP